MSRPRTSVVIAGVLVLRPGTLDALKPHMLAMIKASRAEPGCLAYAYAIDLEDPLVVRVHEEWTHREALEQHFATAHLKAWRAELSRIGIVSRDLVSWTAADPTKV